MGLRPLRPSNLIRVMPAKEVRSIVLPRIHCITDLDGTPAESDLALLAAVGRVGVDAVQVRAKHLTDRELVDLTRDVVRRVRRLGARVIVNDRVDVALATGADGVHLGREDLSVADARRLVPEGFLVGGTCRNVRHAEHARAEGADYVGVGPVFATTSKTGLPDPVGLETLREVAPLLPAVAIAGITADRVPDVMAAGAHGVAVIAAISRAEDPAGAARDLVAAVHRHRQPPPSAPSQEATNPVSR
jgi:thiamine-phosphate pyrophosphorylase